MCFRLFRSTAEAVLQEMDNISSIRQNREVERLRMWTGDTEEVCVDTTTATVSSLQTRFQVLPLLV